MPRLAVFLRAINVGGRRVTNDELRRITTDAGFGDVATFLASGNLVVDAGDRSPDEAQAQIEHALTEGLGFASEAFVRTSAEIQAIIDDEVFDPAQVDEAAAKPQIAFMLDAPDEATTAAIMALSTPVDRLAVRGRELHWLPLQGVGRAALDWAALTPLLGVDTVRSRNTVVRLYDRFLTPE